MNKKMKVVLVAALIIGIVITAMGFAFAANKNVVSANSVKRNHLAAVGKGPLLGNGYKFGKMQEALAAYLGISVDNLKTELKSGKSLIEIAESNGKTKQGLINFIVGKIKTNLKMLLNEGKIDQARYNTAITNIGERVKAMVEKNCKNFGRYHHEWMGRKGFKRGQPCLTKP